MRRLLVSGAVVLLASSAQVGLPGAVPPGVVPVGAATGVARPVRAAAVVPVRASLLFRLDDPRLDEVSGIAAGIVSPGVVYVQNDSGDSARFFALDARTGRVRAVYTVPGATNVDWEDLAVARDARGRASVWLADIGDNDAVRRSVTIYRVDEPHLTGTGGSGAARETAVPQVWHLRYPDGPVDAESLAVAPGGVPYVITKSPTGVSQVYAAPSSPGSAVLRHVATIRFSFTATPGPFAPFGQLAATGAALSQDGRELVVRTYTDAYLWSLRGSSSGGRSSGGGVAAALRTTPSRLALPRQPQGEGICFDGDRLLIDSEGVGSAVYALALPPAAAPSAATSTTSRPAPTSARPTATAGAPAGSTVSTQPGDVPIWAWSAGATLLGLGAIGIVGAVRRRKRGRRAGSGPWPR